MKISFINQSKNFKSHLVQLIKTKTISYKVNELIEKESSVQINTKLELIVLNEIIFEKYNIFPKNILIGFTQCENDSRKMTAGDTIVQQIFLPPTPILSQKLIFGVKIKDLIVETERIGFSYETLEGHVEKGISTFTFEKSNNEIIFKIHTFSKPNNFFTQLLAPLFSLPYQRYCTNKALQNVKNIIENLSGF